MPDEQAPDPLAPEFSVTVEGETYVFRKPTIKFLVEVGYRAADVRRRCAPSTGGMLSNDYTLDYVAVTFARNCAIFELYLVKSDQEWPFSPGPDGKPMVNFETFPAEREQTVRAVGDAFETEVARFRARRHPDRPPISP